MDLRDRKYGTYWPVELGQDLGLCSVDLQGFTTGVALCAGTLLPRITEKHGIQGLRP
jgi:hypothetical protein